MNKALASFLFLTACASVPGQQEETIGYIEMGLIPKSGAPDGRPVMMDAWPHVPGMESRISVMEPFYQFEVADAWSEPGEDGQQLLCLRLTPSAAAAMAELSARNYGASFAVIVCRMVLDITDRPAERDGQLHVGGLSTEGDLQFLLDCMKQPHIALTPPVECF